MLRSEAQPRKGHILKVFASSNARPLSDPSLLYDREIVFGALFSGSASESSHDRRRHARRLTSQKNASRTRRRARIRDPPRAVARVWRCRSGTRSRARCPSPSSPEPGLHERDRTRVIARDGGCAYTSVDTTRSGSEPRLQPYGVLIVVLRSSIRVPLRNSRLIHRHSTKCHRQSSS